VPRISIITATRSALEQDFTDFEHLVVDDASPDNATHTVLDELGGFRQPLRTLCGALLIASYTPAFLRRLVGPFFRRIAASRYASWR